MSKIPAEKQAEYREAKAGWADWLDTFLLRTGMTTTELAEEVGVDKAAVSRWRNRSDNALPTAEHRAKLAALAASRGLT